MMATPNAAVKHYHQGQSIKNAVVQTIGSLWRKLSPQDLDSSFYHEVWPLLITIVESGQLRSAQLADDYLNSVAPAASAVGLLDAHAFSGVAADGRPLESLLEEPLIATKTALRATQSVPRALAVGKAAAKLYGASETLDAGRTADGAALVARPELQGYVRMLNLPSCGRCVVLAGRVYRWSEGFLRHPYCDCRHMPVYDLADVPDDMTTDPRKAIESGKVNHLSAADTRAVKDGADPSQVINATRGMHTAGGKKLTREGVTRRGWAGMAMAAQRGKGSAQRMRPEEIYKVARSRDEAISLLEKNGYIV